VGREARRECDMCISFWEVVECDEVVCVEGSCDGKCMHTVLFQITALMFALFRSIMLGM